MDEPMDQPPPKRTDRLASDVAIVLSMADREWPITHRSLEREPDSIFNARIGFHTAAGNNKKSIPRLELIPDELDLKAVERIASYMQTGQRPAPANSSEWMALHTAASYLQTTRLMAALMFVQNSAVVPASDSGIMEWYYKPNDPDWSNPTALPDADQKIPLIYRAFAKAVRIPGPHRRAEFEQFRDAYDAWRTIDIGARFEFGRGADATAYVRQHCVVPVFGGADVDMNWTGRSNKLPIAAVGFRKPRSIGIVMPVPTDTDTKTAVSGNRPASIVRVGTPEDFCIAFHLLTFGLLDGFDLQTNRLCVAGGSVLHALTPHKLRLQRPAGLRSDVWSNLVRNEIELGIVHLLSAIHQYDPDRQAVDVLPTVRKTAVIVGTAAAAVRPFRRRRRYPQPVVQLPIPDRVVDVPIGQSVAFDDDDRKTASSVPPIRKPSSDPMQQLLDRLAILEQKLEAKTAAESESKRQTDLLDADEYDTDGAEDADEDKRRVRSEFNERIRSKTPLTDSRLAVRVAVRRQLAFVHGIRWNHTKQRWYHSHNVTQKTGDVFQRIEKIDRDYDRGRSSFRGTDIDLFVVTRNVDDAVRAVRSVYNHLRRRLAESVPIAIRRTMHAVTFILPFPLPSFQVILRLYHSAEEVVVGFDLDCCAVALTKLPLLTDVRSWPHVFGSSVPSGPSTLAGLQLVATDRFRFSMVHKMNIADTTRVSTTFEQRLLKYFLRGYEIGLPYFLPRIHLQSDWLTIPSVGRVGVVKLLLMIIKSKHLTRFFKPGDTAPATRSDYDGPMADESRTVNRWQHRHRHGGCASFLMTDDIDQALTSNRSGDIVCAIPQTIAFLVKNPGRQDRLPLLTGSFHPTFADWYGVHPHVNPDRDSADFVSPGSV